MVCFNGDKGPDEWTQPEWEYFVHDAWRHLRSGGRLALSLNQHVQKYGALKYYDEPTRDFFASIGTIDAHGVVSLPRPAEI